ncbi:hypothetical protein FVE85_3730 [Porphyridium purpureum]|uniref:Uncharacterized protein n=1 Tax=Porphyridium purpureum TaxID=35688 RepID=A0A5J4YMN1_PORPP|nr:hypothetical protein FVE85_3730 [Porphyridium purpureum]|eukprot:POR9122..scf249_10
MELGRSRIYAITRGQLSTSSVAALSARPQLKMLDRSRKDPLQLKNLIVVVHLTPYCASMDRCRTFARERFQVIEIGTDSLDDFKPRFAAATIVIALVGEEMSAARPADEFFHTLERSRFAEAIRQAQNFERQFGSVQNVVIEAAKGGLDTMASEHMFSSGEAVMNVRKTDKKVVLHGMDAGSSGLFVDEIADTKFGEVYFSQEMASNFLSFAKLRNEDKGTKYDVAGDVVVVL